MRVKRMNFLQVIPIIIATRSANTNIQSVVYLFFFFSDLLTNYIFIVWHLTFIFHLKCEHSDAIYNFSSIYIQKKEAEQKNSPIS